VINQVNAFLTEETKVNECAGFFLQLKEDVIQRLAIRKLLEVLSIEDELQIGPALRQKGVDHPAMVSHDSGHGGHRAAFNRGGKVVVTDSNGEEKGHCRDKNHNQENDSFHFGMGALIHLPDLTSGVQRFKVYRSK